MLPTPFQLQKESIVVVLTLTLILDTLLEATSPPPLPLYPANLTSLVKT
jgi:hypothetical protein